MREFMLILHLIGLAMALGAGFSNLFLGRVVAKLEPAERGSFMSKIVVLGVMGRTGLGLLILSGMALMTPFWSTLSEMPLVKVKMTLVAIMVTIVVILVVMLGRAQKSGDVAMLGKLRKVAILNFFLGIAIVIVAVLAFH